MPGGTTIRIGQDHEGEHPFRDDLKTLKDDDLYDLGNEHCTSYKTVKRTDKTITVEWLDQRWRIRLSEFEDGWYYRYPHGFEWGWSVRPKLVRRIEELERSVAKLSERIAYWSSKPQDEWFVE